MACALNCGNAIEAHDEMSLNDSPWDAMNPPTVSMDAASAVFIDAAFPPMVCRRFERADRQSPEGSCPGITGAEPVGLCGPVEPGVAVD
jgi:hypothetical protein